MTISLKNHSKEAAHVVTMLVHVVLVLLCIQQTASMKAFKPGDVMLGGLCVLHNMNSSDKCGDLFLAGLGHVEAMIFTIDQINKDPSILSNITLGYDIRDYCEISSLAMKNTYEFVRNTDLADTCMKLAHVDNSSALCCKIVTKSLASDAAPISAVIGPYDSSSSVQIGSLYSVAGIPIISFAATSDELSSNQYRDFFRTVPPDRIQARVQADIFERFNWTYVGTVALDDSYGRFGVSALETEALNRKTFCIAFSEFVPRLGSAKKINETVARIKEQSNVNVIVLWLFGGIAQLFFEEASKQNLEHRTWILSDATTTTDRSLLGPFYSMLEGAIGIQPRDRKDDSFFQHLTSLTPSKTSSGSNPWWNTYWANRLNCSDKSVNQSDARSCIVSNAPLTRKEAEQVLFDPYLGYLVDAVFAVAHALDKMYRCGKAHVLASQCPVATTLTERNSVQMYLRNISFAGLTGSVAFDANGDRIDAYYEIVNIQWSRCHYQKLLVGSWNSKENQGLKLNESAIRWTSRMSHNRIPTSFCSTTCPPGSRKEMTTSCCWNCVECPGGTISREPGSTVCTECPREQKSNDAKTGCVDLPVKNLTLNSVIGGILACVSVLGFVMAAAVFVVFFKYRETPVVKVSNRQLTFLLLLSICFSFILAFLSIIEPTGFLCCLTQFSRYIIYTTFVAILWLKTIRIFVLFQINDSSIPLQSYISKFKYQLVLVALVNCVEIVFLIAWFVADPPHIQPVVRATEYVFYACSPFGSTAGKALYFIICAYVFVLSLLSSFYAFKVRKLPENFNEARFIAFSLYIILLSSMCYYPIEFSMEGWYVAVIACSSTLVSSFGLLFCMFAPKIFIILLHPERNSKAVLGSQVSAYCFQRTSVPNISEGSSEQTATLASIERK